MVTRKQRGDIRNGIGRVVGTQDSEKKHVKREVCENEIFLVR